MFNEASIFINQAVEKYPRSGVLLNLKGEQLYGLYLFA